MAQFLAALIQKTMISFKQLISLTEPDKPFVEEVVNSVGWPTLSLINISRTFILYGDKFQ